MWVVSGDGLDACDLRLSELFVFIGIKKYILHVFVNLYYKL